MSDSFGGQLAYLEAKSAVQKELSGDVKITEADMKNKSRRGKSKITRKKDKMMRDHDRAMAGAHADLAKKFPHLMK